MVIITKYKCFSFFSLKSRNHFLFMLMSPSVFYRHNCWMKQWAPRRQSLWGTPKTQAGEPENASGELGTDRASQCLKWSYHEGSPERTFKTCHQVKKQQKTSGKTVLPFFSDCVWSTARCRGGKARRKAGSTLKASSGCVPPPLLPTPSLKADQCGIAKKGSGWLIISLCSYIT